MSADKRWKRQSHLLSADEYVCPYCGFVADKPTPICPHCHEEVAGVASDTGWVDDMELLNLFMK